MNPIVSIIMRRDAMDEEGALEMFEEAQACVREGQDPEEVLEEWFGLEPDYVFDLLEGL